MKKMLKTGFALALALVFVAGFVGMSEPAVAHGSCPLCIVPSSNSLQWTNYGCCQSGDSIYLTKRHFRTGQICRDASSGVPL